MNNVSSMDAIATDGVAGESSPDGWMMASLSKCIAALDAGVSVNADDRPHGAGEIGVLKTSALSGGRFEPTRNKTVISSERQLVAEPVQGDSILVSRMNTPELVGESCYVSAAWPQLFLPDRIWQLKKVSTHAVDMQWLSYFLQSWGSRQYIGQHASGTSGTMKNLSKRDFLAIPVALPPLSEQRAVAKILKTLDDQIQATEQIVSKLRGVRDSLLQQLFVRSEYEDVTLDELVDASRPICYGILMPGAHIPDGVPVIKVMNIKAGQVDTSNLLRTSPSIDFEYRRSRLLAGDVLLSIRGSVGRVALVPAGLDGANITQDTARIAVRGGYGTYVAHFLRSPGAQRFIDAETVGLAVKGINLRDVRRITVPLPPLTKAIEIADTLDAADEAVRNEEGLAAKLNWTKIGLCADLLTGRVRVPAGVTS